MTLTPIEGTVSGLQAMSLQLPTYGGHPNRMPFSGILVRVDVPSDRAPHGVGGRIIVLTASAAREALPSLLGMGVNLASDLEGHATQSHVGVITSATMARDSVSEYVAVEGIIYAKNYPKAAETIKARRDDLGFSFESQDNFTDDPRSNPLRIAKCTFTGAAILLKTAAAYGLTSIAASKDTPSMDPELKAALDAVTSALAANTTALATVEKRVGAIEAASAAVSQAMATVEPHAAALDAAAAAMAAAGIGSDASAGQAAHLRSLAAELRAEAARGTVPTRMTAAVMGNQIAVEAIDFDKNPTVVKLREDLAASNTKMADMAAQLAKIAPTEAAPGAGQQPARRSFGAGAQPSGIKALTIEAAGELEPGTAKMLKRLGVDLAACADTAGMLDLKKLDSTLASNSVTVDNRMALKMRLRDAGLLAPT